MPRAKRLLLAAITLAAASCARREQPGIQRLAILRFENLTPDPATDWVGRALPEVITSELAGDSAIYAIPASRLHALAPSLGPRPLGAPGISAEAQMAQAAGANRIGYGEYAVVNGRLRVRLTVEDPANRTVAMGPLEASVNAGDPIGAATALARQISPKSGAYATSNPEALAAYVRGLETGELTSIRRYSEQAIAADPNFGPAYLLLVDTAVKQQDRAGAMAGLQAATARGPGIGETSRLRLEQLGATLRGDAQGVERAASALAQASPLDPAAWRSLAETAVARRQYAESVSAYQRALAIQPEDAEAWNSLGYVAAYAGNLDLAVNALRRYQAIRPSDLNPLDSLGDVNLLAGRLKEAEALYLEVHRKNPAFLNDIDLYKAAMARLMTGDVAGANTILGEKSDSADWLWLTGRRKEAFDKLSTEAAASGNRDAQGRAYAELAVWALLQNDREAAARMAARGTSVATPASAGLLVLARLLSMPSAAADEWARRADQSFGNAPVKGLALAYALLLDRHFAEAVPLLRNLDARTGTNGDRSAAIELAWALIETGKVEEAAPLLRLNPIPGVDAARPFVGLYFPRLYQLRAIAAERAGNAAEARENRRIYAALGGS